jgi:hypothetical protein
MRPQRLLAAGTIQKRLSEGLVWQTSHLRWGLYIPECHDSARTNPQGSKVPASGRSKTPTKEAKPGSARPQRDGGV